MLLPSRLARLSIVAAAAALVLSSCGGDNNDNSSGGTDTSGTETSSAPESSAPAGTGDGTLTIGTLLPQTGDLAFLGPPEFAGVDLAVNDINAAGGVLGQKVVQSKADSGDGTPDIAGASVDKLLNANADVIIGAAASSVSLSVIDKIVGAGVVEFSPANTSPAFDTYDDKGLYFRTSPSDVFQGAVLGNLVASDGFTNVAVMARQDSYGEGLADEFVKTLQQQGGNVAVKTLYSADATNYTAEINKVAASKPDAVVLIAFEEATKIVPGLIAKGVGPQDVQTYFVDGDTADYSKDFPAGTMKGVKATFPAPAKIDPSFNKSLLDVNPKLTDFTYGAQSYDATIMTALAATAANDDSGESIASKLIEISKDGTPCSEYSECVGLLESGEDIDYEGASGPCDLNDSGSVAKATIGIQLYGQDNTYKQIDSVSGVID
ncbi:MAG TPA: ABC transporter substrate-binding protein [Nocardioidaceae bacterium]|nr:ABC transporter substrate-binding protein [Nocardioidaceae bacterium]